MSHQVTITLDVDSSDADEQHSTGLTNEAYERLVDALASAGFEIADGPHLAFTHVQG